MSEKNFNLGLLALVGVVGIAVGGLSTKVYLKSSDVSSDGAGADVVVLNSTNAVQDQGGSYSLGVVIGQQVQTSLKMTKVPVEKSAFLAGFADSINENEPKLKPEEIYKNVNALQDSANKVMTTELESKALNKQEALFSNVGTPSIGSGEIALVEFFDYNCPHCRSLNGEIVNLINENNNIKVIYRPVGILTKGSQFAAAAAIAAHKQNKFKEFHNAMMAEKNEVTQETVNKLIEKLGLDKNKFQADVADSKVEELTINNRKMFLELGLRGVPSLFAAKLDNNKKVKGDNLIFVPAENSAKITETLSRLDK